MSGRGVIQHSQKVKESLIRGKLIEGSDSTIIRCSNFWFNRSEIRVMVIQVTDASHQMDASPKDKFSAALWISKSGDRR